MAVEFNHTIVPASDAQASARWWADLLGLADPVHWGPFWQVCTANGVDFDFEVSEQSPRTLHYAFLITEDEFDAVYGRIRERGIAHYADPAGRRPDQINHADGGRGVYFPDPDGHWLEIITRPYGSGTG